MTKNDPVISQTELQKRKTDLQARITPEMAQAELQRRKQAMQSQITPEMAQAELARRNQGVDQYNNNLFKPMMMTPSAALQTAGNETWQNPYARKALEAEFSALPIGGAARVAKFAVQKGLENINPEKKAQELLDYLGGGTAQTNLNRLSDLIKKHHDLNKSDALKYKEPVIAKIGKEELPNSDYLTNFKETNYAGPISKIHQKFIENPTFENADQLHSAYGGEIGKLKKLSEEGKLDQNGLERLDTFNEASKTLNKDLDTFLEKYPELKEMYSTFKQRWRENVVPYYSSPTLANISKKGIENVKKSVKPSFISETFSFPGSAARKIAEDIGKEGKNNILYNELSKYNPKEPESFIEFLRKSGEQKGYENYIGGDIAQFGKDIQKRILAKGAASTIGGAVGGAMIGHPVLGGLAGLGYAMRNPLTKALFEHMSKIKK